VVRVVDRLEGDLAPVALVPLIVLAAARGECHRFLDEPFGLPDTSGHHISLLTFAMVGLAQSGEFPDGTRQVRMCPFRQDHPGFGLGPGVVRGKKSCRENQPGGQNSTSDLWGAYGCGTHRFLLLSKGIARVAAQDTRDGALVQI
jgi:hypothetical protein